MKNYVVRLENGKEKTFEQFKKVANAAYSGLVPPAQVLSAMGAVVVKLPSTAEDVTAERDRRLKAGVVVTVTGYGDIPMQGRSQDMINTLSLKDTARDLKAAGITAAIIPFRDANNTLHSLTADQVIEMVNAGKMKASQIYQVAWDMKDGTGDFTGGIPDDFTDDKWWP